MSFLDISVLSSLGVDALSPLKDTQGKKRSVSLKENFFQFSILSKISIFKSAYLNLLLGLIFNFLSLKRVAISSDEISVVENWKFFGIFCRKMFTTEIHVLKENVVD